MAERLADIVAQIQNVRQLEAVVTAMRGIAASRAQRGRALLAGIDAYSNVVSRAIGQALSLAAGGHAASAIATRRQARPHPVLRRARASPVPSASASSMQRQATFRAARCLLIGTRGAATVAERGLVPAWSAPMATHVDAIPALANRIADALYGQHRRQRDREGRHPGFPLELPAAASRSTAIRCCRSTSAFARPMSGSRR